VSVFADWRAARERRQRASSYLATLLPEPVESDVRWLSTMQPDGAIARRELRFARRAIGLIVAERDALDDRTASDVAHELALVIRAEAQRRPEDGRLWSERWRAYSGALTVRGVAEAPAARLARVLLAGAGVEQPTTEQHVRATQWVLAARSQANEALRSAFGVASMPEDVKPSAM
jgi:hypothetical protein